MGTDGDVLKRKGRGERFADYVIQRINGKEHGLGKDNAFGAILRRADNPATEYQAWEYLISFGCDIEKPWERLPFCTIGAALARAKPEKDGRFGIGKSLASCYEDGKDSDPAKAKLRRLLACDSIEEVCSILRPLLSLIQSNSVPLCYGRLLDELLYFGDGSKKKILWASDFYGRRSDDDSLNA
ncbi:MAG: type I-E CRISPR-associated protein Cse2/CasB [Desulfamplus sp.]|nr:type I-E CRISPR-associated protein Cse2/CasB [Desulfamplus sp.]